jgi:hypothetical protein
LTSLKPDLRYGQLIGLPWKESIMRRLVSLPVLTGLAVAGLLAGGMSAAAAASAPAPDCGSYSSMFYCDASSPVSPVTWTQTATAYGTTYTSTYSASPHLRGSCSLGTRYGFSYSYVYGGVSYASPVTFFICTKLPPN